MHELFVSSDEVNLLVENINIIKTKMFCYVVIKT